MLVIIFLSNEEVPILLTRSEEEAQKIALSKAGKMIEEMVDICCDIGHVFFYHFICSLIFRPFLFLFYFHYVAMPH